MARSINTKLAVVERWYSAYGDRNVDTLCELSHGDIEIVPVGGLLTELPGTRFHGHDGVRTLAHWSYENYPRLRLEASVARKISGWILGSATFVVDGESTPVIKRRTETLFGIDDDRIRRVRTFWGDSPELEEATAAPALTAREREIFQLLANGLTGPEIADKLVLSPTTVRTHVQNGVTRLAAKTRVHALAIAVKRGEITL
jgi:DNA-binding CsgD family transcriptional regulator